MDVILVKDKLTAQMMWIKAFRFNSELHEKVEEAAQDIQPVVEEAKKEDKPLGVVCDECGKAMKSLVGLRLHKGKFHKK